MEDNLEAMEFAFDWKLHQRAELDQLRKGLEYMMIRGPPRYVCKQDGVSGTEIIQYHAERTALKNKAVFDFARAAARGPPNPEDVLRFKNEFRNSSGFNPRMRDHLEDCAPCGRFIDMYECYEIQFKSKDEEVMRNIERPPAGLEEFIDLLHRARDAMHAYDSFDAYWAQYTARQAKILPFPEQAEGKP